jgi:hypothetical protein
MERIFTVTQPQHHRMAVSAALIRFSAAAIIGCNGGSATWNILSASRALSSALCKSPVSEEPSLTFSNDIPVASTTMRHAVIAHELLTYIGMTCRQNTPQEQECLLKHCQSLFMPSKVSKSGCHIAHSPA